MVDLWRPFRRKKQPGQERQISTVEDFIQSFQFAGNTYTYGGPQQTMPGQAAEKAPTEYTGYATMARYNGVVAACLAVRMSVFSATRFQWQRLNNGRPSEMFGTADLSILERPWAGGTTQDLLARMILDADLVGNSYWTVLDGELVRLRPDWVDIIVEPRLRVDPTSYPKNDLAHVVGYRKIGYLYTEGGGAAGGHSAPFKADEVVHFAPLPDPLYTYRGMSWLTPIVRETLNDNLMSDHKRRFFENAATPNMIVSLAREVGPEAFEKYVARIDAAHKGVENAYKTMYLGGGADATVVGSDFQQMNFSQVQGAGETRIAAAAGVPPVIVGLSEGLQAATYSNYAQARRRFADGTVHPLWQNAAGSLEQVVRPTNIPSPSGVRLWYDSRDVPFLREDRKDASEIQFRKAQTIRAYTDAGFTPESAVLAADTEDTSLLEHTGLFSVQLQPPGAQAPAAPPQPKEGT